MSSDYLKVVFLKEASQPSDENAHKITPFAASNGEIYSACISRAARMTDGKDVKTVYNVTFDLENIKHAFLPGDTIGILPSNNENLIDQILARLNVTTAANQPCELRILEGTSKKNPSVPRHLPPRSMLRNIFLKHVDVHTPPKKLFLKSLAKFAQDPEDRARLEHICSPKGSTEYIELITTTGRTLLGLLNAFASCQPPIEVLLEHLPPLLPRPYSISSSCLAGILEITFFVLIHEDGRKGLCTGWLEDLIVQKSDVPVPFYFRQPTAFRLQKQLSVPMILIATGTGIAPFRGFFQDLLLQRPNTTNIWLFYGCRYKDKDCLFKDEIEAYVNWVFDKVDFSFSREQTEKQYVQHSIEKSSDEFFKWVLKQDATIFVCGDTKTVVRDVKRCICENVVKYGVQDGEAFMQQMESEGKFIVDTWV